ncbi:hypothetical protein BDW74DRAFT_86925 [Aspergillus multicolor]|uniref:CFEM domain-containing protein n=1 Tax=Aspergillus multicolor TaxID=41759 RepID=UPI003CCE4C47
MGLLDNLPPLEAIPECALTCITEATSKASCGLTDIDCFCHDQTLAKAMESCVLQACSVTEIFAAKRFSESVCGVPPKSPTEALFIVSVTFLVLMIICAVMRTAARVLNRNYGMDDLAITLSLGLAIAIAALVFRAQSFGVGKDIWNIPPPDINHVLYLFVVTTSLYPPVMSLIKISMLLLYLRIFPHQKLRIATFIMIAVVSMWGIAYTIAIIFNCTPRSYGWLKWDGEHQGKCLNQSAMQISHAILNIVFDVIVICLPLPVLLKLNMSKTKKTGVCLMFLTGLVVTALSIIRLTTTFNFLKSMNPTRDFVPVCVWSVLEIDLGIICACFPGMRALLKIFVPGCDTDNDSIDYDYEYNTTQDATGSSSRKRHDKSFNLSVDSSGRVRPSTRRERNSFVPLPDLPPSRNGLVVQMPEQYMVGGRQRS